MSELSPNSDFFAEVKAILAQARGTAVRAVNTVMVEAYWQIGRRIVEEQQGGHAYAQHGSGLLKQLSKELKDEFGNGFSYANLRNFRQFYLTYPSQENCYALRSNLSWTHHRTIMRVEDADARQYYLETCAKENWSSRTLERQIKSNTYQRLLSNKQPASETVIVPTDSRAQILSQLKDPYVLEFLNLSEDPKLHEKDLETALISELQKFLLELGGGFSFVARQMRISTETSHFYLDLVFYHYVLKCFVVIDLKTEKLSHQDIGQMDMYVRMFDDLKRGADDNPTIGLILCADKDKTMVQYSVLKESEQLFASKYRLHLPTEEQLIAELEREQARLEIRKEENS